MRVLLDTHSFLWFIAGSPMLSQSAKTCIEDAANEKLISIASIWEMAIKISIGDNSISFDMDEVMIYSRLLEGPFPAYQRVIPAKNEKELIVSRSAIMEATKRVSILSDSLTKQVVFSIGKAKVMLNVSTQELGEAREEIDASFTGEAMDVGYNATYVQDILKTMDAEEILFLLDRPDNAAVVKPASEGGNLKQICIIMPLRIG